MDNQITVSEIQEIHYERLKKRVEVFEKVLANCYKVIRHNVKKESEWAVFRIPEIIFGYPLYNIPDCANYIYRALRKNGFTVKYVFPNFILIFWSYRKKELPALQYIPDPVEKRSAFPVQTTVQKVGQSTAGDIQIIRSSSQSQKRNPGFNSTKDYKGSGSFLFTNS